MIVPLDCSVCYKVTICSTHEHSIFKLAEELPYPVDRLLDLYDCQFHGYMCSRTGSVLNSKTVHCVCLAVY